MWLRIKPSGCKNKTETEATIYFLFNTMDNVTSYTLFFSYHVSQISANNKKELTGMHITEEN